MSKVFLSHSSNQKQLVETIANRIGRDRCIYDKFTFEAGMDNLEEILKNLERTDLFVVFISNEALNSTWVQSELSTAKKLFFLGSIKQFLPIIIDERVNHTDKRIPDWIKHRNLQKLTDPFLVTKKIAQLVREIVLDLNPLAKAREELFVGRNQLMEEFESQILTTDNIRPVCFIASGLEGIGRRTFMRKALTKTNSIIENYLPAYIYLDSKESIEDFILKFHEREGISVSEILKSLQEMDYQKKVALAIETLETLVDNNEKLFILDSGCIIQPNKHISEWFLEITNSPNLTNSLSIILISRWRPNPSFIISNKRIKSIHIDALSERDRQKLFVQYAEILSLSISPENSIKILEVLNGIPSQVFFAIDLVNQTNIQYVLDNLKEVVEYGEAKVFYLIENIKKDYQKLDILVLISNVDFISYDFLFKIIGDTSENHEILEEFFILGIFDSFGGFSEHIRVNYTIADYIRRSKFKIKPLYKSRLKKQLQDFLAETNEYLDVSELLINVKNALLDGVQIRDKYFLPSFVLKTIVDMYNMGKYKKIIPLADSILQNASRMEYAIRMEIKYWLCLALAREKMSRFEVEVRDIEGTEHDFLFGFYHRRNRRFERALEYIKRALEARPYFPRAKRELVNILLSKNNYAEALDTARDNYQDRKTNAFHIHAYFICLIRKTNISSSDIKTLNHLLESIKKTNDKKSEELYVSMMGEYQYYINKDVAAAIIVLKESLQKSQSKYYPFRALFELYMKQGQFQAADDLKVQYKNETFEIDELENKSNALLS